MESNFIERRLKPLIGTPASPWSITATQWNGWWWPQRPGRICLSDQMRPVSRGRCYMSQSETRSIGGCCWPMREAGAACRWSSGKNVGNCRVSVSDCPLVIARSINRCAVDNTSQRKKIICFRTKANYICRVRINVV